MRRKMTRAEARRFAHREAAHLLMNHFRLGAEPRPMIGPGLLGMEPDGPAIRAALESLAEQHARYGPKATDLQPAIVEPHTTPLLDVIRNNEVEA